MRGEPGCRGGCHRWSLRHDHRNVSRRARLDAVDSVEVRPRVSGYLQAVHFRDGALVKKGDLLFTIDPRPYAAVLHRAEADLELEKSKLGLARKNLARAVDLLASHAISQ